MVLRENNLNSLREVRERMGLYNGWQNRAGTTVEILPSWGAAVLRPYMSSLRGRIQSPQRSQKRRQDAGATGDVAENNTTGWCAISRLWRGPTSLFRGGCR